MIRRAASLGAAAIAVATTLLAAVAPEPHAPFGSASQNTSGWVLPPNADETKNPHAVDDKLLATGRAIYKDKCERCHGPGGLGDGPDADPDHQEDMDLTNPKRAERNSDGVVFYKVSNGRRRPKMPAFKEELTEDQLWAVVAYTQRLRKRP